MVNYTLILVSVLVPIVVSIVVCILVLGRVFVNQIKPLIEQVQTIQDEADHAIKTGMSAMGQKSIQVRQDNKLEKMVAKDLLEQFPEIEIILNLVSPATAEEILDKPERALRLIDRYKEFLPFLTGGQQQQKIEYDL